MVRRLFTLDPGTLGRGNVIFAWRKDGNYLAVCGANRRVCIADRQGKVIHQITNIPGQGACMTLDWDYLGETLAILFQSSSFVTLWNFNTQKQETLETNFKDLSWMKWSRNGPQLAIGAFKGSVLLYNKKTLKKTPIIGKHEKKVTCGAWNSRNLLALGGEDRALTISDCEGETKDQVQMKMDPAQIQFSDMKLEDKGQQNENTISVNLGGKTLLLYNLKDTENPIELAFQPRYGSISSYLWFGDGYVLMGFSTGFVVVISTHLKEIGQEVNSVKFHKDNLSDITYCPLLQKGASIGDNLVRIFEMTEMSRMSEIRSEKVELENEFGTLTKVEWTDDGQILTVSSKTGYLYTFLTKLSQLSDVHGSKIMYLTSLRELCIKDIVQEDDVRITIDVEPSFLALGPKVAAVGMNDSVWYHRYGETGHKEIMRKQYLSTIKTVKLSSEFAAVLMEGRVQLHALEGVEHHTAMDDRKTLISFPRDGEPADITCIEMSEEFLVYGTSRGSIVFFSLEDWQSVNEYRYVSGIRSMFMNPTGPRLLFIDETGKAFLYNAVNDQIVEVDDFPRTTENLLWDISEWGVFIAVTPTNMVTFVYSPYTRRGAHCGPVTIPRKGDDAVVCITERPYGITPILCHNGGVTCQIPSGSMIVVPLQSHMFITPAQHQRATPEQNLMAFYNNLNLNRLEEAWRIANSLQSNELWQALVNRALFLLDVNVAIRVYRRMRQPGMVNTLEQLKDCNEKNLLLGHIAVVLRQFSDAQVHFLRSSQPTLALEMQRDLMHWEEALKLAETHAQDQIPIISREFAQQLEFNGEYSQALDMYNKALQPEPDEGEGEEETEQFVRTTILKSNRICTAGIARNTIRLGNIQQGVQLVLDNADKDLCAECAAILEERKPNWSDAAKLYEKAGLYDKAISIYIEQKSLQNASRVLPHIVTPKIFTRYADLMKAEGKYKEAEAAYEKAGDWDAVVLMCIQYLDNLSKAYTIVRRTKSADSAALVAKHCKKLGDVSTAIEFLLLAKQNQEAFELAQLSEQNMGIYSRILGDTGRIEDYLGIAQFYEGKHNAFSGDFYYKCGKYDRALARYLLCGDQHINKAIEVVGKAKQDVLTHQLIDFLMGGSGENTPKEPTYIFKLYMALGNYEKAAKTAVVIAKQEQESGSYKNAHAILFNTYRDLEQQHIRVPSDLKRSLLLLHSYIIVKNLVKNSADHTIAARMLIRVAKNITKFPKHVVQILTSCVIECSKVDFKLSAFEYASVLVLPDNRNQINEKYKKKIESIIRKSDRDSLSDPEEPTAPCPYCNRPVPETELHCPFCKNHIPYCIFTGRHMVRTDWSCCPSCRFPALHSKMAEALAADPLCPMCSATINPADAKLIENPDNSYLQGGEEGEQGV